MLATTADVHCRTAQGAAHEILRLDARTMLPLLPGVEFDLLCALRREVSRLAAASSAPTWQEAWNAAVGATPGRPGVVRVNARRCCPMCGGAAPLAEEPPCQKCWGSGSQHEVVTQSVLWARVD